MTKEEIYRDFCKKVQSGEYRIYQVTRSNKPEEGLQDFGFILKKRDEKQRLYTAEDVDRAVGVESDLRFHTRGMKFTQEEFDELVGWFKQMKSELEEKENE